MKTHQDKMFEKKCILCENIFETNELNQLICNNCEDEDIEFKRDWGLI